MTANLNPTIILDALVPISRFNKGEASKIFEEVRESGCKIVVNDNAPACVLITPDKYREMLEQIEDSRLIALALEREKHGSGVSYPAEDVYAEFGVTVKELEELEVDFDCTTRLRGMFADFPEMTVEKFLERKRAEKE